MRILIVEDESLVALDIERALTDLGYTVTGVSGTAEDAQRKFIETTPDIVLMDICLRGDTDGITAAAQMKAKRGIPVIFLTAHSDDSTLARASIVDPSAYLVKPFKTSELKATIQMVRARMRGTEKSESFSAAFLGAPSREDSVGGEKALLPFGAKYLSDAKQRQLLEASRVRALAVDEILFHQGDFCAEPFVVLKGKLATSKISPNGREIFTDLILPKDLAGLMILRDPLPLSFGCRAIRPSSVLMFPRAMVELLVLEEVEFHRELSEYTTTRLRRAEELNRALAHDKAERRIAAILLSLASRLEASQEHMRDIDIDLTRNELAALTGTTVETTIRITKEFERAGLLDLSDRGHVLIIDRLGLQRMITDNSVISTIS